MTTLIFPLISLVLTGLLVSPVFMLAGWVKPPAALRPVPVRSTFNTPVRSTFNTLNRHHI